MNPGIGRVYWVPWLSTLQYKVHCGKEFVAWAKRGSALRWREGGRNLEGNSEMGGYGARDKVRRTAGELLAARLRVR